MNKKQCTLFVYIVIFFSLFFLLASTIPRNTSVLILRAEAQMSLVQPESVAVVPDYIDRTAIVTAYTAVEIACEATGCLMSNGKPAQVGFVACPRELALGTIVEIGGTRYECGDRTAQRFDGRFDLFFGYDQNAYDEAIRYGIREMSVRVFE